MTITEDMQDAILKVPADARGPRPMTVTVDSGTGRGSPN